MIATLSLDDVTTHCLSFLSVEELILDVRPCSKHFSRIVSTLLGDGNSVASEAIERYHLLKNLHRVWKCAQPEHTISRYELIDKMLGCATSSNAFSFTSLIDKEDLNVKDAHHSLVPEHLLDRHPKHRSFLEYAQDFDRFRNLYLQRQCFLSLYFSSSGRTNEYGLVEGKLTEFGTRACNAIFDYFDKDQDGMLSLEELHQVNHAVGLELTTQAYKWVCSMYETDSEGRLTRKGYRELFTSNFTRVPRLMCRDLVTLQPFFSSLLPFPVIGLF